MAGRACSESARWIGWARVIPLEKKSSDTYYYSLGNLLFVR